MRINNPSIRIDTNTEAIETTESEKLLGGIIHQNLKWSEHIVDNESSLLRSLSTRLNALRKICCHSDLKTRLMIANGLFMSKLIYLLPLWGGAGTGLLRMLQVAQNTAARYVTRSSWYTPRTELMKRCNWMSVKQLSAYHSLVITHKTLLSQQPKYLYEKFNSQYPCYTRLSANNSIRIDGSFNADLSLTHSSFRWRSSSLYNTLPVRLRTETKLSRFKFELKGWVKENIDT